MTSYIIRRLIQAGFVLIIVSLLVFLVMRLLPGDPILIYLGQQEVDTLTDEEIERVRGKFGLDEPLFIQYISWISDLLRGNLGISIHYDEDVGKLMAERFPATAQLGVVAFLFSSILGIVMGVLAAVRRQKMLDTVMTVLANLGITVPVFWLGILFIYFFGLELRWFPLYGYTSPFDDFWLSIKKMVMPVICLAAFSMASTSRQARSSMLEVISQDYIRTARAKGLTERIVVMRHALKNGLIPIITLIGFHVRYIFGGQVIVEKVFNIPGIGRLLVDAVSGQDYAVVQSTILVISTGIILTNLIVDISYGWLDPRIRYG